MAELPSGTVTFLFTDIEGSTVRWEQQPEAMQAALVRHDALVRAAIVEHGGHVVKTMGDAFHAAFSRAPDAVAAAMDAQRRLQAEAWGEIVSLPVRMSLHTGAAQERDGDYYGNVLNRAARILSAGHGGQVLLSQATYDLIRDEVPEGTKLIDLGEHRLKDLTRPERIFQLVAPDLPSEFPPPKSLEGHRHNLPVHPTVLLGRDKELVQIRELLSRDDVRLVTLTGPGGTGKTRLSLEVAADLIDSFTDGVFFVALAPITHADLVAPTIAQPLGIRELGGRSILDGLREYLRDRRLLLVLDNFEQVLPAATVVADLLGCCPHLKILVTSRAVLHLRGEREYAVPPLALPDPTSRVSSESIEQYGAVALFVQRAREVKRDFELTVENTATIAAICLRLDGLPLAIELAAARIKLLPPDALFRRLERRLPLLSGGARDLPARHRTLRDAIAWSYDLLTEIEQRVFRRLSTFVGGFTLEAAEAVCDAEHPQLGDVLDCIGSLVDQSLLRQWDHGPNQEPRFGMLETIREYALEHLEGSGESGTILRRHAEFFLAFAEKADRGLRTAEQGTWLARLESEHGNLRGALAWGHAQADPELALGLAGGLALFWYLHGHIAEGRSWLDGALAVSGGSAAARGKVLAGAGQLAMRHAEFDRASELLDEGLSLYRASGDAWGMGWCYSQIATVARARGHYERAATLFEESARLFRATGDTWGIAWAVGSHAIMATQLGDFRRATALLQESLEADRRIGNWLFHARGLTTLGLVEHGLGNHARAESLLNESLGRLRDLGDTWGVARALEGLGRVAQVRGDHGRAESLYKEGLALYRNLGHRLDMTGCLDALAGAAVSQGDLLRAGRLLGAADAIRAEIGTRPRPAQLNEREQTLAAVCAELGDQGLATVTAEGRAMTLDEAVAYALGSTS
jgi:predicted ATPase/class 3 adenylate cyclase